MFYFNSQLQNQLIEDRFSRLERELEIVKAKNFQQEKEIDFLKEKIIQLEQSKGSKEKKKDDAVKGYDFLSSGVPKAPITGPSSCQDIENTNPGLGVNNYYIVRNINAKRMKLVYCSFDGPGNIKEKLFLIPS